MSELSHRILALLEEKGLSYGELAEMTKIPKSALQRYATGETEKIPLPRIEAIAKALGVSSAYLIGWGGTVDDAAGKNEKQPTFSDGLSDAERTLLNAFRLLSPERQAFVIEQLQALSQLQ